MSKGFKEITKKKRKIGITAKQLANLRPAKKGEPSRNPLGGQLHNPLLKALRNYSKEIFQKVIEAVITSDEQALEEMQRPEHPSLLRLVATAMQNAIRAGDYGLVERMSDRLIGPITKDINIKSSSVNVDISHTEIEITNTIKKLESDV